MNLNGANTRLACGLEVTPRYSMGSSDTGAAWACRRALGKSFNVSLRFTKASCYDNVPHTSLATSTSTEGLFLLPAHAFDVTVWVGTIIRMGRSVLFRTHR